VALEFDSSYYHSTEQQKEKDSYKDFMLTKYGGYDVVRISENTIKYEKPSFRSLVLNAMYGVKQRRTKASIQIPSSPTSTV
jgi:very-short-patch-repair endonuclease